MVLVIGVIIVFLTILVGVVLAVSFSRLDHVVEKNQVVVEQQSRLYNPRLTLGFEINPQATSEEQIKEARQLAAKKAASLPRGANMGIGRLGQVNLRSAGQGAQTQEDPWTAAKIAQFHDWEGVKSGFVIGAAAPVAPAATATAPVAGGDIELIPGKDYPVIEITDDMSPADTRKARIANAKAKSAAMKAAKAAGAPAGVPAAASSGVATAPTAVPAAAPAIPNIEPPQITPITDDMPDDDRRKARIANSKAKSAFNKALKAAGIDPKTVEVTDSGEVIWPQGAPPAAAAPTTAPAAAAPAIPNIEPPQITPITDDMPDDDKRKARIANSKAKSAFNKALKAAGIDPKTVEVTDSGEVIWPDSASPVPAQPTAPAAPTAAPASAAPAESSGAAAAAAAGIPQPELIEITDDMSPDETRQARIANSKARSAYNKALKAAGIDPKSVQ